uniref:Hypothetical membrane protein n=1 Tax=Thermococcus sp. AMT11 TaxID=563043 RepID=C8BNC5_9EURY|nr:hypothetical membrane protein [Thermococcus sp. AMT11]
MALTGIIIFTIILVFGLATMLYSSGEMAFFISLGIVALLFLWDVSGNQGQLMMQPIISIGPWLGIRLWTALFLYLSLLGGYVFGNWGKAIVIVVLILIVLYSLGALEPLAKGEIGALKDVIQVGGG